jgi:hypothetical protein
VEPPATGPGVLLLRLGHRTNPNSRILPSLSHGWAVRVQTIPHSRLAMLTPSSRIATWITIGSGAFLISLCFLVGFVVSTAWMSRQPMSLKSICSNVLELSSNRDDITTKEKWRRELDRLGDDCAVALYKYDPNSTTYGLTSFESRSAP